MIGLCRRPFDESEGADKRAGKPIPADWKIQDCALRRCAVESGLGHHHLAHRVFLQAGPLGGHALFRDEKCSIRVGRGPTGKVWPFRIGPLRNSVMNMGGMFCKKYSDSASSNILACCFNSLVTC